MTCEACETSCTRGCYGIGKCKAEPVVPKLTPVTTKSSTDTIPKFNIALSRPVKQLKFGTILVNNDEKSLAKAKAGQVNKLSVKEQNSLLTIKVV